MKSKPCVLGSWSKILKLKRIRLQYKAGELMTDKQNQKTDTDEEGQQEENEGLRHNSGGGRGRGKRKNEL